MVISETSESQILVRSSAILCSESWHCCSSRCTCFSQFNFLRRATQIAAFRMGLQATGFTVFFLVLNVALLCAPLSAHAQDPCLNGGVCCTECNTRCLGRTIRCKSNCISPCVKSQNCNSVGEAVASGVASLACTLTQEQCKVPRPPFAVLQSDPVYVSLATCCNVVIGSCQGKAESIPCMPFGGNYGNCNKAQFDQKYRELASSDCKQTVCGDSACSGVLAGNPKCAKMGPVSTMITTPPSSPAMMPPPTPAVKPCRDDDC